MAVVHQSCVGYGAEPFASLVADYPGDDVYPSADFRTEWGPAYAELDLWSAAGVPTAAN